MAVVQHTFTHKQYAEYGEWNVHNYKKTLESAGRAMAFALQLMKNHKLREKPPRTGLSTSLLRISKTSHYISTVMTLEVVCYWSARYFVFQDVLGSVLVLETDYITGVSSSFFPQTFVTLKHIRTLQNHDLLTILHSEDMYFERLTDCCAYYRYARLTSVSFCRCASPCFMPRIFSPETKSKP
jgi:hypothetical protein